MVTMVVNNRAVTSSCELSPGAFLDLLQIFFFHTSRLGYSVSRQTGRRKAHKSLGARLRELPLAVICPLRP